MACRETELGGNRDIFPPTGILIRAACDPSSLQHREALNRFSLLYWRPIYACIRKQGYKVEDAKDLTQEFIMELLQRGSLARYDAAKGRLRHYIKGALRLFLAQARRSAARRGATHATWNVHPRSVEEIEAAELAADLERYGPDELFDKHLAQETLARSLRTLRRELESEGRRLSFSVYEAYDLHPPTAEPPTYESVGRRFNLPAQAVRKHLEYTRKRLDTIIMRTVAEFSSGRAEAAEELDRNRSIWKSQGLLRSAAGREE